MMDLSKNNLIALAVVAVIVLLYVYGVWSISLMKPKTSALLVAPDGDVFSDPLGMISSGSTLRSFGQRSDGAGGDVSRFLGAPEPPVFYDMGDVNTITTQQQSDAHSADGFKSGMMFNPDTADIPSSQKVSRSSMTPRKSNTIRSTSTLASINF